MVQRTSCPYTQLPYSQTVAGTEAGMAGRVAVIVFLSLCLAIAISHASSEECDTFEEENKEREREVGENKVDTVYESKSDRKRKSVTLYVKPGQGFQGVSLEVTQAKNSTHVVWFPVDQSYTGTMWVELDMLVKTHTKRNHGPPYVLHFELKSGDCEKVCQTSSSYYYNMRLRVVAHGSSTWRRKKTRNMHIDKQSEELPFTKDTTQCINPPDHNPPGNTNYILKPPPPITTPPIPSTPPMSGLIIILSVVMVVVALVLAVVAVVVFFQIQQLVNTLALRDQPSSTTGSGHAHKSFSPRH
ncbi:uncharacterized protein LOC127001242 isoform X3 [Eriocheir sinensis]|uniref:uncharacterized protein LOC127001242 isoform X3 n=1 Tax=Eriocheir sinensis TaxID=95602 RepID=UPI0021C7E347|nr:uncharacterized protein LOC127001242 isoform X3 [Eriocheir sinensis]